MMPKACDASSGSADAQTAAANRTHSVERPELRQRGAHVGVVRPQRKLPNAQHFTIVRHCLRKHAELLCALDSTSVAVLRQAAR